ncbi:MAG: dicarboxylate/amino acid:cation symporter [Planctomycetaceae bacterium]|jgi:Na+/H+-dicarboxylate symporter|nr:dicarboxylate/amino acid:cation symporter [Planctomycetaceae bacterium]
MKKILTSLPVRLLFAVIVGLLLGFWTSGSFGFISPSISKAVMNIVVTVNYTLGQLIFFCVPLIVIGFVASSIAKLGADASKLLGIALLLAYVSSIGAGFFSTVTGYAIIPQLNIVPDTKALQELPPILFKMEIPPVMSVMSALVLSITFGLFAVLTKAETTMKLLNEFQQIILQLVIRVVIPVLPFFIGSSFCQLAYEGSMTRQLPVFLKIIVIVIIGHYIWLTVLYVLASIYTRKNSWEVLRHYAPAYLTAIGTMSSAATLPVALECASKSKILRRDMVDFGIPLFANIHLCGSVLTEVFFALTVSQTLYGHLPPITVTILFVFLLGLFAVAAPGVPGGTVIASLGLISGVLGFDANGVALVLTIFALQDSFGTACNVTGDGALTLILTGYSERK